MANQYIDLQTLRFVLYEVHRAESLFERPRFADHNRESIDIFLDAVKDFADKDLYPYFREMDEQPAHFKDGQIVVHPQVGVAMRKGGELGFMASMFDYEDGGMQLPYMAHTAIYTIMEAANNHIPGYWGLTFGAADLIVTFGTEELKATYVPQMQTGEWAGTMCLTEPQAGSSLSDVVTTAYPQPDGSYRIKGQKIFISGGDYPYVDNVVHLLLARIEGAPAGTKGISLFVVPKNRPDGQGGLAPNDVITAGDFQKMGQRGYCTTHLVFGENSDCHAWLVGEAHQGLKHMFQMMNGARIDVGRGAMAIANAAYHASLQYAQERPQGRLINDGGKKDVSQEQTLIINHPDVRRMVLLQKAIAEGSMSLVMQASYYHDMVHSSEDAAEKERYNLLMELLLPVVKTYPSEMGRVAVNNGLQILGGYGFCSDFVLQQYLRDIRIFSLYEGTTGIQSLDLLGRKISMGNGRALQILSEEMGHTIRDARAFDELKPYAEVLKEKMTLSLEVLDFLTAFAQKGEFNRFLSDATLFMEFFGTIVVGWQWLKMATEAKSRMLMGQTTYSTEFYESKVHTMKFYFKYEMPKTTGLAQTLMDEVVLTLPLEEEVKS